MRAKQVLLWSFLLLLALSVAAFLYTPSYKTSRVDPSLLALKQPYRSIKCAYYFDGGSVGIRIVDDVGTELEACLKANFQSGAYDRLFIGETYWNEPGAVEVPYTEDNRLFLAEQIDRHTPYAIDGDHSNALLKMRGAPRDYLRMSGRAMHNLLDRLKFW